MFKKRILIQPFRKLCTKESERKIISKKRKVPEERVKSHQKKLEIFFNQNRRLSKDLIPTKILGLKRVSPPDNLYLIDPTVAKKVTNYILPSIETNKNQIVCETNAGLGLISAELLKHNVKFVRLYESCPEFQQVLKNKFRHSKAGFELCSKDLFLLHRYEYLDRQDNGNRVEILLKGVPKKDWNDDPVLTVIGPMPTRSFIRFLIKSVFLQTAPTSLGRIQLFTFLPPKEYIVLTAGPHLKLHTYQRSSIFFQLLFNFELLDKFPVKVFLPWQSASSKKISRYASKIDPDFMYFVKINFKKELPISQEHLLALYYFIGYFFKSGGQRIIPSLEKWLPDSGTKLMFPQIQHEDYFKNLNIFTKMGELTPLEMLAVFRECIQLPNYVQSDFINAIETHFMKTETIETSLDDQFASKTTESEDSTFDIVHEKL